MEQMDLFLYVISSEGFFCRFAREQAANCKGLSSVANYNPVANSKVLANKCSYMG